MMRFPLVLSGCLIAVAISGFLWTLVAHAAPAAQAIYMPLLEGPPAGDSLNVNPEQDNNRSASATIPLNGGEIVATAANGTRFTLSIPPGALLQTTTITLTPVVQIAGLPDVQLVGAVEIRPLNLLMLQASTLKIEPAQPIPVAQEYPFAYYRDGQDFHPYPIQPYSTGLNFPIGNFEGGYGIAQENLQENSQATNAYLQAPAFTPADPEAQLRSQIAELIRVERVNQLQGGEPDPTLWPKVRDLSLQYYNQVIKPLLQPSTVDCEFAKANIGKALSWLRTITLIFGDSTEPGADPAFTTAGNEIMAALIKSLENCYRKAAAPCLDWEDPRQLSEVFRYYRALLLLGAEGNVPAPQDLPECIFVDVQLQSGAFHYEFQKDPETGYDTSVHFQFVDDSVSGFGIYYPYLPPTPQSVGPTAIISITALIDDLWQPVPLTKRFFCRDQKVERLQELVITFAQTTGEPPLPPQVYADNIGCWRWSGTVKRDLDYTNLGPSVPEYFQHSSGELTLERSSSPIYFPSASQDKIIVNPLSYQMIAPSSATYDEKLHHVDSEGNTTCVQTLNETIDNAESYVDSTFPALRVPNARFTAPRETTESLGSELNVDLPYTTQGTTCPREGESLDVIILPVAGEISADGRRIELDETSPLGEGTGTSHRVVELHALRE